MGRQALTHTVVSVAVILVGIAGCGPPPGVLPTGATKTGPIEKTGTATAAAAVTLYVNPGTGDDRSPGTSGAPLKTIQAALDRAMPGTTIRLAPGIYRGNPATTRPGTATAPIRILGPETGRDPAGRYRAVLYGTDRVLSINHSYYELAGFTIDGQERLRGFAWPADRLSADAFKQRVRSLTADGRLIYVGATGHDVTGVTIRDMYLHGAGGECVRLRNRTTNTVIEDSVIAWCGVHSKGGSDPFHNGEGVYIGTSPKSIGEAYAANDTSSGNVVRNTVISTFGSECFDVKENAHNNSLLDSTCEHANEPVDNMGSAVELRGYANVVRGNVISDSRGFGVKLSVDGTRYDKGSNVIERNSFNALAAAGIYKASLAAERSVCGNTFGTRVTPTAGRPQGNPATVCGNG
ncbi:MAG: DUF1565 domain-containing protein [Frankiaceae bacterium]